ncbi:hypothetical protein EDD21DRAFT_392246 [Dissophora ornata]|nr:hypothetical protein EDD21DRAFT_392246 [Dissophora ornata]
MTSSPLGFGPTSSTTMPSQCTVPVTSTMLTSSASNICGVGSAPSFTLATSVVARTFAPSGSGLSCSGSPIFAASNVPTVATATSTWIPVARNSTLQLGGRFVGGGGSRHPAFWNSKQLNGIRRHNPRICKNMQYRSTRGLEFGTITDPGARHANQWHTPSMLEQALYQVRKSQTNG